MLPAKTSDSAVVLSSLPLFRVGAGLEQMEAGGHGDGIGMSGFLPVCAALASNDLSEIAFCTHMYAFSELWCGV